MSVVGIGTDIVDIDRLRGMSEKALFKLAQRVLVPTELERFEAHNFKESFLAKRWAGKEAAAKALTTGIAQGVSFQHMYIHSTEQGAPELQLSGVALEKAQALGAKSWHISLSDETKYATAFVVLSL